MIARLFRPLALCLLSCGLAAGLGAQATEDEFSHSIRPVLEQNCSACHNPSSHINFLEAETSADIQNDRGLWRNVAAQMRNRTMPPVDSALSEDDRLRVSTWIDSQLRQTACLIGDYAGAVALRRLNRREYRNTIRDLLGIDFNVSEIFPSDGAGGAGFDTNGETLFIPPLLMERYLEAAQQILDRAIVTPDLVVAVPAAQLLPAKGGEVREIEPGEALSAPISIYLPGDYDVLVEAPAGKDYGSLSLKVDAGAAVPLETRRNRRFSRGTRPILMGATVRLARGLRSFTIEAEGSMVPVMSLTLQQQPTTATPERLAQHYRLLGVEPGAEPLQARKGAEQVLRRFLRKAYRRPVTGDDVAPLLTLYDRAEERGDPFEERMKLALKAVLVGPDFLFKIEDRSEEPGIHPLSQYELASRLSYFLWSTMPDDELDRLADAGRLQDPDVLAAQVDRMLDDPRSRTFMSTFVGQWLGTQDVGGRAAPLVTELRDFYTPVAAADLRAEPIRLFERIIVEDRSLLELLTADYTFLTEELVRFYQVEDEFPNLKGTRPQLVQWPNNHRGGVLTMGAVMAMTAHYRQTSPVLRGAWVLEALLGTPVPPPPPDIPLIEPERCEDNCSENVSAAVGMREKVLAHRVNPTCSACHNLMDPIGFALENFDWNGRWREAEFDGSAIDATGSLPSGETFDGPAELREVLLAKKDDFLVHLTGKLLAYSLGRRLQDGDSCTAQQLASNLRMNGYGGRTLIRDIVLSVPFRNTQGGDIQMEAAPPPPPKVKRPMVIK